jgi:hypothetical protein
MSKPKSITDDLRGQLGALEGRQVELLAERDEVSYSALVDRDPKAIKKLAAVNEELSNIANQSASVGAALNEAAKREAAAEDADRARRKRADAEKAKGMLGELEQLGLEFDTNVLATIKAATAIRAKVSELRQLTGAGPSVDSMQMNLKRALATATMGGPLHTVHLAPADRVTISQVIGPWLHSFRNWINVVLGDKPAKNAA